MNDDVLIVGSLDDKELRKKIGELVDYVADNTQVMANKFEGAINKMNDAMKDFAVNQKVSVDLMKQAWREMSSSFDAMVAAQSGATGSGNGKPAYPDNTVGHLQEIIAAEEKRRKGMQLDTQELRDQNKLIAEQKNKLKDQTTPVASKILESALSKQVVTLQDAKDKLSVLESIQKNYANATTLSVAEQNKLTRAIAQTKKQIDSLNEKRPKTMSEVLGMDESSLESITAKMRALKRVQVDPSNAAQVKQLGDEYQRLKRLQAELMGMNIQHTKSNNYLAQSFGYIRNRIVYALTLGAITSFTKQIYEIRGQYELLERSLGVLVNSFERGSQVFHELNQMAIESPFTLMELAGAAKQLTAYNFAAKEVVDTTRRLADISAALGVPMERLTYNLGQIRAQTVLTARDARDFANAGLPIVASLAEHFTELEGKIVTTGDVYDRMSKKMVSYSDVMAVLNKMTDEGGKFFEFQAKQAETLRVQMANLTLAWNNMLNDIGKSNQGLLTLPISGLKALLQNWQSIDRVLKSMLATFVLWKVLQVVAIRQQWAWATATGATAKQMGFLANAAKGLFASMKALAFNPWTWVFVGIQAIVDLAHQFWNARQEMHELNQEIRDNANEASESMLNYLNNKGNKSTLELAKQNKLTAEQGERAWESLKQQIEQSALSANGLIAELLAIEDVNERVRVGFDYAERIQKAQAALQDLKEDSIKVNQDYTFLGIGEEGLVTDLQDYANEIIKFEGTYKELQDLLFTNKGTNTDIKISFHEFGKELDDTAESINNFIRAYNITDPLQINEILERVRSQIKAKNPEIKGEVAKIFDISLDQKMAELTNGAVDRNASLWNMFMERLRHNSNSAFQDINDEWIKKNTALSKEQQEAVDANLQYFKDSMPYAYDAVAKMVSDASKLRIKIGVTFGGTNDTDFQKQVNERIGNAQKTLDFGGGAFLPTNNDNLSSWVKTQQQAIKKLGEENKKYNLDNSAWAKQKIKDNNTEIQQRKNLLDLFNQSYLSDADARKGQKQHKKDVDEVAQALQSELKVIREMQSNYDKLRKSGVSSMEAVDLASKGYEATIARINLVLQKFGISKFNAANFAGKDVRGLLNSLEEQRKALLASGKVKTSSLQALDVEIQKLTIDAKSYDMKKVTDGLNNELGKIKEEYELAVELDANPELGGIFADMMGIDEAQLNELPRTFNQVVAQLQSGIDELFAKNNIEGSFDLTQMLDKGNFDEWVKARGNALDDSFVGSLEKIREYANKVRLDETKETTKEWSTLVEKYGGLQAKLVRIAKNTSKEQLNIIRKFGSEKDKMDAQSISNQLMIAQDPETVTRLQRELADLMNRVVQNNPQAVNIATATINEDESQKSKAFWEDFKNSNLYSMTFEDMSRVSTRAIQLIIDKLEVMKDKVKEDPASMKALIQSLEDARKELEGRSGTVTIVDAIGDIKKAQEEVATTRKNLAEANKEVTNSENALSSAQRLGDAEAIASAVERLRIAREKQAKAEDEAVKAENGLRKGTKSLQAGMETLSGELENVQGLLGVVSKLFAAAGDKDTAEAINAISEGFSIMTTVIMGVVGAMVILESTTPWLLAIAAALSVVVGLFSWLSSNDNAKITEQVEESELAVKRLENAYKNLEYAINKAYGMATIGANQAAIANKKLQLVELKRQLALERSRDEKDRDEDKIESIRGQIFDLQHEIQDLMDNLANELLGISSVADAATSFMDDYIEALRSGEDAMASFNESVDDMIANMVKKMLVQKIIQPWFENAWNTIQEEINARGKESATKYEEILRKLDRAKLADMNDRSSIIEALSELGTGDWKDVLKYILPEFAGGYSNEELIAIYEKAIAEAEAEAEKYSKQLSADTQVKIDDIRRYAELLRQGEPIMEDNLKAVEDLLKELGLMKDTEKDKALSALQQGIQGITEDTAGAIEAYMNIVAQRVFEQNEYLMQIRDIVVGFNLDVQVATIGQMLYQMQQSYQVQQAIQARLDGWSNANGMAVRVEMV